MDVTSLIGLALGLSAIVVGQFLEGGNLSSLLQPTAFLIVIGGTTGAVLLQTPLRVFVGAVKMLAWIFRPPASNPQELIGKVVDWGRTARRDGLLALEARIAAEADPFVQKGLQLLVDGIEPTRMREVLETEIDMSEEQMKLRAKVWESAGGYSPTIGILGAVMGLIHVMENLADPARLGSGIAVAFVATIYGVGSANLIFIPISKKLTTYIRSIVIQRQMLVDGLVGVAQGDNPRLIESRMQSYLAESGEEAPSEEKS